MKRGDIAGSEVGAVALGGASWTFLDIELAQVGRVIDAAMAAGVRLVDTAIAYSTRSRQSHNERLIAQVLAKHRGGASMLVATKGGHYRHGDAFPIDGRPETIIRHCEMSLHALDVESIWLYQLHWPDPRVPLAETMGAFAELQAAGKICAIGLSNVTVAQLDEATGVVDVASVQNRFSPWHQESADVLDACSSRKIPFLAYQPFGGPEEAKQLSKRSRKLNAIARSHGVTCHQVVVAWLRARSGGLVPIVGATTPASIIDAANAAKLELTLDEIAILADEFG